MKRISMKMVLKMVSILGLAVCAACAVWGIRSGIFSSQQMMENVISNFGLTAPLIFVLVQTVQVVIPILPGGVSCLAGVILFGAVKGFVCNYVGICIGSFAAFGIARLFGRPLLPKLFDQKLIDKYDEWTKRKNKFERLFAAAILLPVAPDDFLCYLAGTTAMSWQKFAAMIIICKPFAIIMYSILLNTVWDQLLLWLN